MHVMFVLDVRLSPICSTGVASLRICVVQVRHFAAHYAGDEGLARPFSAMPSDRNLAWSDQPCGLPSPDRPAARLRPDAHVRDQPPATSPPTRQVASTFSWQQLHSLLVTAGSCDDLGVCGCVHMLQIVRAHTLPLSCWHRAASLYKLL